MLHGEQAARLAQLGFPLTLAALPFGIQVVGGGHGVGGGEGPALGDCHQDGAVPGVRAAKAEHRQATFNTAKTSGADLMKSGAAARRMWYRDGTKRQSKAGLLSVLRPYLYKDAFMILFRQYKEAQNLS